MGDPLHSLCLLFYDLMQYADLSGKSLQTWFNSERGHWQTTSSQNYLFRTRYTRKRICYRIIGVAKSRKYSDFSAVGVQIAIPPKIAHVTVYGEIYVNDRLVEKRLEHFQSGKGNIF